MSRPHKSGRIVEGCVIKTAEELFAEYSRLNADGRLCIVRTCSVCGREFEIVAGRNGQFPKNHTDRRRCEDCSKARMRKKPENFKKSTLMDPVPTFRADAKTEALMREYSPFRAHGPAPLPKDRVPPHHHRQERVWTTEKGGHGAVKVTSRR